MLTSRASPDGADAGNTLRNALPALRSAEGLDVHRDAGNQPDKLCARVADGAQNGDSICHVLSLVLNAGSGGNKADLSSQKLGGTVADTLGITGGQIAQLCRCRSCQGDAQIIGKAFATRSAWRIHLHVRPNACLKRLSISG